MPHKTVHIGIIEDDDDLRQHLVSVIKSSDFLELVFATDRLDTARQLFDETSPAICLVDVELPDGNGNDFTRYAKSKSDVKILILTILADRKNVLKSLEAGADGYLLKDTLPDQLLKQIKHVIEDDTPISPQAAKHLLSAFTGKKDRARKPASNDFEPLTNRELQVLQLFERGLSYEEVAKTLAISANTVRHHVKAIYSKLNVKSRSEAIFEARQVGLLKDE